MSMVVKGMVENNGENKRTDIAKPLLMAANSLLIGSSDEPSDMTQSESSGVSSITLKPLNSLINKLGFLLN